MLDFLSMSDWILHCSCSGNEGRGLRPSVANVCSRLITIPPSSTSLTALGLDSLNVSVAAGKYIWYTTNSSRYGNSLAPPLLLLC